MPPTATHRRPKRRLARLLFFGLTAAVIIAAVWSPWAPTFPVLGPHNDLVRHVVAFAVLAIAGRPAWDDHAVLLLGLGGLAGTLELLQLLVPGREAHWDDLAASLCGIGLGWLAVAGMARFRRQPLA